MPVQSFHFRLFVVNGSKQRFNTMKTALPYAKAHNLDVQLSIHDDMNPDYKNAPTTVVESKKDFRKAQNRLIQQFLFES